MSERMCPCGGCKATWEQAVADLMHGPAALNRDQAEARLQAMTEPVHWIGDAPTSLHGNGASSFERTSNEPADVTCKLCLTLLARENDPNHADGSST